MSQEPQEKPEPAEVGGAAVSWVMIGVLTAIVVAIFAFDDERQQSTVIIAALILGLVGILIVSIWASWNKRT